MYKLHWYDVSQSGRGECHTCAGSVRKTPGYFFLQKIAKINFPGDHGHYLHININIIFISMCIFQWSYIWWSPFLELEVLYSWLHPQTNQAQMMIDMLNLPPASIWSIFMESNGHPWIFVISPMRFLKKLKKGMDEPHLTCRKLLSNLYVHDCMRLSYTTRAVCETLGRKT